MPQLILSQNEVWLVKYLEIEVIGEDTVEYWDETSVSILKTYDSIPYLTDFYIEVDEIKKYGGFLKLQEDIRIDQILKKIQHRYKARVSGISIK